MRVKLSFYRLSDTTFYDHINAIYQFIKSFLDKKRKCLLLRNMEPLSFITNYKISGLLLTSLGSKYGYEPSISTPDIVVCGLYRCTILDLCLEEVEVSIYFLSMKR